MARTHREWLGSVLGLLVFLGGIALLLLTFKLAYELFTVPPERALKLQPGKSIDLNTTANSLSTVLVKTVLLVVMGLVSSLIASRGVTLYTHSAIRVEEGPKA